MQWSELAFLCGEGAPCLASGFAGGVTDLAVINGEVAGDLASCACLLLGWPRFQSRNPASAHDSNGNTEVVDKAVAIHRLMCVNHVSVG